MFDAFRRAFKIKDIRKKIGYTFLMFVVRRWIAVANPMCKCEVFKTGLQNQEAMHSASLMQSPVVL